METGEAQAKAEKPYVPADTLEFRGCLGDVEIYVIPATFRAAPESYDLTRQFLERLITYFTAHLGCTHETFIPSQFQDHEITSRFSGNARNWLPRMGLGVWPHREPPRLWTVQDMENMDPQAGPTLMHSVFRVTAGGNARLDAMRTMTGSGCGIQILCHIESKKFMDDLKQVFLQVIQDRVFRIFPWYIPLLDLAALTTPAPPLVLRVLQETRLYIRESREDGGILLLAREPLEDLLPAIGCKFLEAEPMPKWRLTA